MNKLKITREQEEKLKEFEWHTTSKEHAFELYKNKDPLYYGVLTFYNNFTPEQFALLLCGWYKIKEEYKVGDWIFRFNNYSQITKIENDNGILKVFTDKHKGFLYDDEFRKATEEEIAYEKKRRFWDELGRRVEGYKLGDVVRHSNHRGVWEVVDNIGVDMANITHNSCDSEKTVYKSALTLVTPAEDRLDLE